MLCVGKRLLRPVTGYAALCVATLWQVVAAEQGEAYAEAKPTRSPRHAKATLRLAYAKTHSSTLERLKCRLHLLTMPQPRLYILGITLGLLIINLAFTKL